MTGLSINKQIYSILNGDEELKKMCKNIYPIIAEEKTTYPFIIFKKDGIQPLTSKQYVCGDNVTFTVTIVNDKYALTVDIAERVRALFEHRRDGYFTDIQMTSNDEEFSNDAYLQKITFLANIMLNH